MTPSAPRVARALPPSKAHRLRTVSVCPRSVARSCPLENAAVRTKAGLAGDTSHTTIPRSPPVNSVLPSAERARQEIPSPGDGSGNVSVAARRPDPTSHKEIVGSRSQEDASVLPSGANAKDVTGDLGPRSVACSVLLLTFQSRTVRSAPPRSPASCHSERRRRTRPPGYVPPACRQRHRPPRSRASRRRRRPWWRSSIRLGTRRSIGTGLTALSGSAKEVRPSPSQRDRPNYGPSPASGHQE